jgi:hypothetical protein
MFLNGEWPGVQRERAAERGNTISGENPRQKLAHGESYYLDEKGADNNIGNLMKGKYRTSKRIWNHHVHRNKITVLKAGMSEDKTKPMNHLRKAT